MPKGYRANNDPIRSKRRQVLFSRVLSEVRFVTELKPYFSVGIETLRRIAKGGTQNPHRATDEEMARYLKTLQDSYDDYLDGDLTLDQLWDKRGENIPRYSPNRLSIDNVLELIRLLSPLERLDTLQALVSLVCKDHDTPDIPPIPPMIELSPNAIDKVRALFKFSILADEKEIDKLEVDPALIDFLTKGTLDIVFPESVWEPLLPHLYRVSEWIESPSGIKPRLDYSRNYEGNLNLFLADLEIENNGALSESDNQ